MADRKNENSARSRDRELGMHHDMARRDFLNGIAIGMEGLFRCGAPALDLSARDQQRAGRYDLSPAWGARHPTLDLCSTPLHAQRIDREALAAMTDKGHFLPLECSAKICR